MTLQQNELRQLVMDTLYDRRKGDTSTCLKTNVAGIELLQSGSDALRVIEDVIREEVGSQCDDNTTPHSRLAGLDYVFGAYLVITARTKQDSSIDFLRRLPRPLLFEALRSIPIFFRKMKDGYNFDVPPNAAILSFLTELSSSPDTDLGALATHVIEKVRPAGDGKAV